MHNTVAVETGCGHVGLACLSCTCLAYRCSPSGAACCSPCGACREWVQAV